MGEAGQATPGVAGDGSPPRGDGPEKGGLGRKAAGGFLVMVLQTIGVRAIRLSSNVALAWLLFPDDFALFAFAATLHQFVSVLKNAGLRDILIHREARIGRWINPAAWMSIAMGLAGAALMVASAPLVAWFYGRDELILLVFVLAGTTFFQSIGQVPMAMLHASLRFKTAASIEAVNSSAMILLTVYYAWAGLGPVSFVLPMLNMAMLRAAFLWWLVRPRIKRSPELRRWRYLVGDSARLISADVARTVVLQGDYIVLGRAFPNNQTAVGHYFFSYRLSTQFVYMFAKNLDTVLMPSLSKLQADVSRQTSAFLRAIGVLAVVGVPLCLLQAALVEPVVRLLLPARFHPTIPYIAVLSIGMAGQLVFGPATSMIRSQGRFRFYNRLTWVNAAVFLAAVILAAVFGSVFAVAVAVAVCAGLFGVIFVWSAIPDAPHRVRSVLRVFARPLLVGGVACGSGWLLGSLIPEGGAVDEIARIAVISAVAGLIYVPSIWVLDPASTGELLTLAKGLLNKVRRRRS